MRKAIRSDDENKWWDFVPVGAMVAYNGIQTNDSSFVAFHTGDRYVMVDLWTDDVVRVFDASAPPNWDAIVTEVVNEQEEE